MPLLTVTPLVKSLVFLGFLLVFFVVFFTEVSTFIGAANI